MAVCSHRADVPEANQARPTGGSQLRAVGRKTEGSDVLARRRLFAEQPAVDRIVNAHLVVETGRRQHLPVGAISQRIHRLQPFGQVARMVLTRHVPQVDPPIGPRGGQHLAVRAERRGLDPIGVRLPAIQHIAALGSMIRTRWSSPTAARSFPDGCNATLEMTGVFSAESAGANSMTLMAASLGHSLGPLSRPARPAGRKNDPASKWNGKFQHNRHPRNRWFTSGTRNGFVLTHAMGATVGLSHRVPSTAGRAGSGTRRATPLPLLIGQTGPWVCGKF